MRSRVPPEASRQRSAAEVTAASAGGGERADLLLKFDSLQLVRQIGEGGQAVVHEALQSGTGRRVAVKMLHAGAHAPAAQRARFEQEAHLVARLEHENIVRVIGTSWRANVPCLVMELVEGQPLDAWLEAAKPSLKRRMEVLRSICSAVAHAHSRMIVHRDLKPSNVLVDAAGRPKVLDFGIARDLGGESLTSSRDFLGTMAWAAPEQVTTPLAVDARTDVHGLGLLLYFLLTGRQPHVTDSSSLVDAAEAVVSRSLLRPSSTTPGVGAELDAIVAKATEKDPDARYQTVDALCADIDAWREGRPVTARKPTLAYVAWKLMRRHPFRMGLGLVIAALSVVALVGWVNASRAEARAVLEAAEARAVADYMVGFFEMAGSGRTDGAPGDGWTLLDTAYRGATLQAAPRSDLGARLLISMGRAYQAAGYDFRADWLFVQALLACRDDPSTSPAVLGDALSALARSRLALGSLVSATALQAEALTVRRAFFGEESVETVSSRVDQARVELAHGDASRADQTLREVLAMAPRLPREHWSVRADALELRAGILEASGDGEQAVMFLERALRTRNLRFSAPDPAHATVRLRLGSALVRLGRAEEADAYLREAVGLRRRILGVRSPGVAEAIMALAEACLAEGRNAEALLLAEDSLATWRETYGAEHPRIASAEDVIARATAGP